MRVLDPPAAIVAGGALALFTVLLCWRLQRSGSIPKRRLKEADASIKPLNPKLPGVYLCWDLFPAEFLQQLMEMMDELPANSCSKNMYAQRYFFRSEEVARRLLTLLPASLGFSRCLASNARPGGLEMISCAQGIARDAFH